MDVIIIAIAALFTSILTFFSGFGIGTILLPIMALFVPLPIAITITAVVHLIANISKLLLLIKNIELKVIISFGLPAMFSALIGAYILSYLATQNYSLNILIGLLLAIFATIEIIPTKKISITPKYLPIGGVLSGFFGGISGFQGALRSIFLLHTGLDKSSFIATNAAIACLVDLSRLLIYSTVSISILSSANYNLMLSAIIFALIGTFLGRALLNKITINYIRIIIVILLYVISILLCLGTI